MARLEQLIEQIGKDREVRRNLIEIRQNISDESLRRRFLQQLGGDYSLLVSLLEHEDPKVRRNAALILGMTEDDSVLPALMSAWEKEETLYVREDYLKAVSGLDYREYLPRLEERIHRLSEVLEASEKAAESEQSGAELCTEVSESEREEEAAGETAENPLWDNNRHLLAELARLRQMTERYEKHGHHRFIKMNPAPELLLRTNVLHADVTAKQINSGIVHVMRGGVHIKGGNLQELMKVRTWTECLFPIPGARPIPGDEKMIASRLRDLKIWNYLNFLHEESGQPFRYRIELKNSSVPAQKRGEYIRRIASRLDALEKGKMRNSNSDYEVELRLIERRDQTLVPMLKLFTLPDTRFAYRKETTAQSTAASTAALAAALAAPYLKEGAQVLDPFCGVGTLLIERCLLCPADPVYGVDRYAEAIEKARVNSETIQDTRHAPIHYVNKDFFDFTHAYPFDEIITHLPDPQEAEAEAFCEQFLTKAATLLKDSAVLAVLTDVPAALKKAAAGAGGYAICDEFLLNERAGTTELILRYGR